MPSPLFTWSITKRSSVHDTVKYIGICKYICFFLIDDHDCGCIYVKNFMISLIYLQNLLIVDNFRHLEATKLVFVDSQFMILQYRANLSDGECVVYVHLVEFVLVDKKKRRLLSILAPVAWTMVYQGQFLDLFLVLLNRSKEEGYPQSASKQRT